MDRTPAHLADMLRFTQELRSLANGHTLETFTSNRVLCLAVEKLFINLGRPPTAWTANPPANGLTFRGGA
jgi:uncharacterized protein with HEPN domain